MVNYKLKLLLFQNFNEINLLLSFYGSKFDYYVDFKTLIDAKSNPDEYQNLIVCVWGFSTYFKDLPKDYQDVLIKMALENEGKNH